MYVHTSDAQLVLYLNQLTQNYAADAIISKTTKPFDTLKYYSYKRKMAVSVKNEPKTGLLIYTKSNRYWISASDIGHGIGSHPLHGRISFIAHNYEELRRATNECDLVEVCVIVDDKQIGGLRNAWFCKVALQSDEHSIIENYPGGREVWFS